MSMEIKDMPMVTTEQVLSLRQAAIKAATDNTALREELAVLKQSLAKLRADAIRPILSLRYDSATSNGESVWCESTIEEHANKIEAGL